MNESESAMAQQVAQVAIAHQKERTGRAPASVTVVLSEDTLVIALHDALTPAEKALAITPAGAAQVQEFHRQLFLTSADSLRKEIKRITGRAVREAAADVEPASGTVVHAFTTGNVVQVFLLAAARDEARSTSTSRTDLDKVKQDVQAVKEKATGLTDGVTEDGKADGQAIDIVKSISL